MTNVYISDLHFNHKAIIQYANRPFADVDEMNRTLLGFLLLAEQRGARVHVLGDVAMNFRKFYAERGLFRQPSRHVCVSGNHDQLPKQLSTYQQAFGVVKGVRNTWQTHVLKVLDGDALLMLSHAPQEDLHGCDYNLHGHVHNRYLPGGDPTMRATDPERVGEDYSWSASSPVHINVCAEAVGYRPRTLKELLDFKSRGVVPSWCE